MHMQTSHRTQGEYRSEHCSTAWSDIRLVPMSKIARHYQAPKRDEGDRNCHSHGLLPLLKIERCVLDGSPQEKHSD